MPLIHGIYLIPLWTNHIDYHLEIYFFYINL